MPFFCFSDFVSISDYILVPIWAPFWFRFRSIPHTCFEPSFRMRVSLLCSDFWSPQSSKCSSNFGKTDSCLKLSFLKQIEEIMISGSIWASFFIVCHDFRHLCFHRLLMTLAISFGSMLAAFWYTLSSFSQPFS